MNVAHLHLLLTHLPIVGTLGATLIVAYALLRWTPATRDLALGAVVLVSLTAIAAYATGGGAESVLEHLGVAEAAIEPHESAAEAALIGSIVTGAIAIAAWFVQANAVWRTRLLVGLLLALLVADGLYARAGFLGGAIRHPEILMTATNTVNA